MGKKGGQKRFIDPKKDVLTTFTLTKKAPQPQVETESDAGTSAPGKNKKVMFQLRCEGAADKGLLPPVTAEASTSGSYSAAPAVETEPEHVVHQEQDQQSCSALPAVNNKKDPLDFTEYGVYYHDGYDYGQHLLDLQCKTWADPDMDIYTVTKEHPQQHKKDRRQVVEQARQEVDREVYAIPMREQNIAPVLENEFMDEDSFDDADSGELPDNLIDFLDGEESVENFDEPIQKCSTLQDSHHEHYFEGVELDYGRMPHLEHVHDDSCREDSSAAEEDNDSDVSSNMMDVSNVSISGDEEEDDKIPENQLLTSKCMGLLKSYDADFPTIATSSTTKIQKKKSNECGSDDEDDQSKLDKFFDGVQEDFIVEEDEQKEGRQGGRAAAAVPVMESSKGIKYASVGVETVNEHFESMMLREYGDSHIGGEKMDEVEGFLPDNAPQFLQALDKDMRTRSGNEIVTLVGPNKETETLEEELIRQKAIQFSKNWRNIRPELVELLIPDPKAMKYNACNMPTVRNVNMPAIIKLELKKKKKDGLSLKDLKQHDMDMNTPHRDVDEELQTYRTALTECSYRPPNETTEERRERKISLRELRRGRREEKKANILAHKDMMYLTIKTQMNAKHCKTLSMI